MSLNPTVTEEDAPAFSDERASGRVGQLVDGRWKLERLLGVGGMASVYEARHRNGKRVAIKILHAELALNPDVLKRFLREGYAANSVKHAGAVSVLDDGTLDDRLPYLVMEYLEGESLDARLERLGHPLPLEDVLAIGVQVLDVLVSAHERDIVHRDLKPDNLFLSTEGRVKVLDFGIARLRQSNEMSATATGIALGTPTFMPREQAHGDATKVGPQADLWALGATLYYALTMQYLYTATSAVEFLAKLVTSEPRPLRELATEVPEAVAAVIDRALRHDLGQRWASAQEMKQALLDAAAEGAIRIPPTVSAHGYVPPTAPKIRVRESLHQVHSPAPSRPSYSLLSPETSAPSVPVSETAGSAEEEVAADEEPADEQAKPAQVPTWIAVLAVLTSVVVGVVVALWIQSREGDRTPPPRAAVSAPGAVVATTGAATTLATVTGGTAPSAPTSTTTERKPERPASSPPTTSSPSTKDLGSQRY